MKELYLKEIIERINEDSYIYTPLSLCRDMLSSIDTFDGKNILVIRNVEFIYCLYEMGINMDNVHYTVNCELKRDVAINLGIDKNKIYNLEYKSKEVNFNTDMKFDVIVQNPPYNPNSLWKKFVEKAIDQLEDDGQMVVIHPSGWRESSTHNKLCDHLKEHISELHICDYENFKDDNVRIKTDWYLYNKNKINITKCFYPNGDIENTNLKNRKIIFRFSTNSIQSKIYSKVFTCENNGMIAEKGFNKLYDESKYLDNGKYRQCGGKGRNRGNGWTVGKFVYTDELTKHQFENKVVAAYTHKPRAQYFSKEEQTGVILGNYWLTDNKSLPILLNSKMFWKIYKSIISPDDGEYGSHEIPANIPAWYLRSLNFENLDVQTEEELYEHYNLTEEEINFCES